MNKKLRQQVFDKFGGRCAYCGCILSDKWQVDHKLSKHWNKYLNFWSEGTEGAKNQIDHIDNLMPACVPCNHYKRELCIESHGTWRGFRNYMLTFHLRLKRLPKKTSVPATAKRIEYLKIIAEKYDIAPDKPFSGKFYYETISP